MIFLFVAFLLGLQCAKRVEVVKGEVKEREAEKEVQKEEGDLVSLPEPIFFEWTGEDLDVRTFDELFERALELYADGEVERALRIFRMLSENAPDRYRAELSLYNLAMCLRRLGKDDEAEEIFRELSTSPHTDISEDAFIQLAKIRVTRGEALSIERSFSTNYRNVLFRTLVLLSKSERQKLEEDELRFLRDVIWEWEGEPKVVALLAVANHNFLSALEVELDTSDTEKLFELLERKARFTLEAQRMYFRAIRERDAWWITYAIFKLGETYRFFVKQILESPPPDNLSEEEKEIYRKELVLKLEVPIKTAISIYERNIKFARRVKIRNRWVERTERSLKEMERYVKLIREIRQELDEGNKALSDEKTE